MTAVGSDPWARVDALWGTRTTEAPDTAGETAFYGRCSTEDQQDPVTSRSWQLGNARRFVEPLGGYVSTEFFDIGQSRSVPWHRRPEAAQLLGALKDPTRCWSAVVVGEGTRCWFGNQFSLIAPRLAAYGVTLWVPELGGRFEPRNPSHTMLMNLLGGMSESERQHVQARVRSAMDAQVVNEGRHQGGRAPYGYIAVDGDPHPHPRKAAEGLRLRVLQVDPGAAAVVRRIYREYLDNVGDQAIANGLNRDDILCPSASRPEQNRHRRGDGWQGSTVRSILENPRYTGYAVFGRWTKTETLLDPDDVSAGHVVRFRRASPETVVRSRGPAHPEIVTVEDFTLAQLLRRSKAVGGLATARRSERTRRQTSRCHLFQGMIRCGLCGRKMECRFVGQRSFYRCRARASLPDSSPPPGSHPGSVSLREDAIQVPVTRWLASLLTAGHLTRHDPDGDLASRLHSSDRATVADAYRGLRLELRFDQRLATLDAAVTSLPSVARPDADQWLRTTCSISSLARPRRLRNT